MRHWKTLQAEIHYNLFFRSIPVRRWFGKIKIRASGEENKLYRNSLTQKFRGTLALGEVAPKLCHSFPKTPTIWSTGRTKKLRIGATSPGERSELFLKAYWALEPEHSGVTRMLTRYGTSRRIIELYSKYRYILTKVYLMNLYVLMARGGEGKIADSVVNIMMVVHSKSISRCIYDLLQKHAQFYWAVQSDECYRLPVTHSFFVYRDTIPVILVIFR